MKGTLKKLFLFTKKRFKIACLSFLYTPVLISMEIPIVDFPIGAYSQNTDDYILSGDPSYTENMLSSAYQKEQLHEFYRHYYDSSAHGLSPWSRQWVSTLLPGVVDIESKILSGFDPEQQPPSKKHYGENFKEHDQVWWSALKANMDLETLSTSREFKPENRAIAVANTSARALPDASPDFFHPSLPGEGFPFDNLQESAIWAGTPLYVVHLSADKGWVLALVPEGYFAWFKSDDVAYVSNHFIRQWQMAAGRQLVAVAQTAASIFGAQGQFLLTSYIGAVFPQSGYPKGSGNTILVPTKGPKQQAKIEIGTMRPEAAVPIPLPASPQNMAKIINQLKNRPYGWGGLYFLNDCSQEIKNLFTPFGIWLPRNSSQQARYGTVLDVSASSPEERMQILREKGRAMLTVIHISGHVMLYMGHGQNGVYSNAPIVYQNVWGLSPPSRDKRYVIGQSLFFPLLPSYPEAPDASLISGPVFELVYLDALSPSPAPSTTAGRLQVQQFFTEQDHPWLD